MKLKLLIQLIFLFFSPLVFAEGGWSSGGGELLKDARNPWFLNNTTDVYYCVSIDEQNFGATRDVALEKINQAIKFWQGEFSGAVLGHSAKIGNLQIASQKFHEIECNDQVDIRFQFGTLNKTQIKYLKTPSEFAAVSVRTSYRKKDMKGKGFVYISPVKGPLAYNPEGVAQNAWTLDEGNLLYLTLLHELGHVFGLPHMGSLGDLMSESYVEFILTQAKISTLHFTEPHFLSLPTNSSIICAQDSLTKVWSDFFELSSSEKCLQFIFNHNQKNQFWGPTTLKVLASNTTTSSQRLVAELPITIQKYFPVYMSLIWLPPGQDLFSKNEFLTMGAPGILGITMMTISKQGYFLTKDSKSKHNLSVRFEQGKGSFTIEGVNSNGEIINII
ncbi:MAG: hypothetical protein ACXWRU_18470 [Pseudobdellovibrionaceae bacterium]